MTTTTYRGFVIQTSSYFNWTARFHRGQKWDDANEGACTVRGRTEEEALRIARNEIDKIKVNEQLHKEATCQ